MDWLKIPRNHRTRLMSHRLAVMLQPGLKEVFGRDFQITRDGNVCALTSVLPFDEKNVWAFVDGFLKHDAEIQKHTITSA